MTQPQNQISQGFRAAWRDVAAFLLEILWRWSFAFVALLLLFAAGSVLLAQLKISDVFQSAVQTQNTRLLAALGLSVLIKPRAELAVALASLAVFILAGAFLWSVFAAAARRIVVRRLSGSEPLSFYNMLAVQCLRALVALATVALMLGAAVGGFYAATQGGHMDLFRFYMVCAPSVLVLGLMWLWLNWRLSLTAIFGRQGQNFREAGRQARQAVRQQRSDFAGTAFLFFLLRTAALLAAVAVIGLTSHMMATAPQSYAALAMTVALGYFVISDFLYVARVGAYLALKEALSS